MVSYSLYLTHPFFIERGLQVYRRLVPHPDLVSDVALVVTLLTLVTAGGALFYQLVESHFARSIDASRRPAVQSEPAALLPAGLLPPISTT